MTAAELIERLRAFPPGATVGYVNRCADDGAQFTAVGYLEFKTPGTYHMRQHPGLPATGAIVLE